MSYKSRSGFSGAVAVAAFIPPPNRVMDGDGFYVSVNYPAINGEASALRGFP